MISNAIGLWKLTEWKQRDQVGQKALMKVTFLLSTGQNLKSYARSFEEECSVPSKTKTMKTKQEYCPFRQKGFFKYVLSPFLKEIFWKFTEVVSHLLTDVVKPN